VTMIVAGIDFWSSCALSTICTISMSTSRTLIREDALVMFSEQVAIVSSKPPSDMLRWGSSFWGTWRNSACRDLVGDLERNLAKTLEVLGNEGPSRLRKFFRRNDCRRPALQMTKKVFFNNCHSSAIDLMGPLCEI
jgi:hypothetical protein